MKLLRSILLAGLLSGVGCTLLAFQGRVAEDDEVAPTLPPHAGDRTGAGLRPPPLQIGGMAPQATDTVDSSAGQRTTLSIPPVRDGSAPPNPPECPSDGNR